MNNNKKEKKNFFLLLATTFVIVSFWSISMLVYQPEMFFDSLVIVSPNVTYLP